MQSKQLLETLNSVKRLDSLLTEEFEALKNQNLEFFETLQAEKLKILEVLASLDFIGVNLDQAATQQLLNNPIWNEITSLLEQCKRSHQRNELLISKQLDSIRGALEITVETIAMENGKIGEQVLLKNPDSGKEIRGIVSGRHEARGL